MTATHTSFWVGVERRQTPTGTVPVNQMYVERVAAEEPSRPYPVVLVHGGGQGLDWLGTPDGRPGWAQVLAEDGYEVLVVDRPGHGRSPHDPDLLGPMGPPPAYEFLETVFAPPPDSPLGEGHTQWPGDDATSGEVMDQLLAGAEPMPSDLRSAHLLEQRVLAELLDQVGPAIVVTHSAGGPAGFLAAEARPESVLALVAIEPLGPPFLERPELGISLEWGLAAAPFEFDPAVTDVSQLGLDNKRRLVNLGRVPIAVVSSSHSIFGASASPIVAFLRRAGCQAEELRLADHGFDGNGHGMMLERNNREVLAFLLDWIEGRIEGTSALRTHPGTGR